MNKLLVIADDFTGAMDTGVQFSKKGVPALVLTMEQLSFDDIGGADCDSAEVLVVDTESRHLPAKEARDLVVKITLDARAHGFRRFYKKTDSALRGNIGSELAGLLEAGGDVCLTFVPAFPKSRRVTRNGIHYIDGVEAARSIFSKDPFTPVTRSSVADIIHLQADVPTENITSDAYEKAGLRPEKKALRILDAESMEDIGALGAHLKRGGNLNLLAGCAGFAEILPELLELQKREMKWERSESGLLVVAGSVNPISIEQLAYGESIGFSTFTLSLEQKLDASYINSPDCGNFVRGVTDELKRSGRVIVKTAEDAAEAALIEQCPPAGMDKNCIFRRVAENIGLITMKILNETQVGNLVVFGGDTLHGVLSKIGGGGVVPLAEIAPGVAAAKVISGRYHGLVITKSGGLGNQDVLQQINDFVFKR
ncbi:MAG: four-carbon acid sugar kinase family protein [Synergistaceae bacterium]|nr:four-carbon acid sugar kinase family protein [Synergistaceae bacterium]